MNMKIHLKIGDTVLNYIVIILQPNLFQPMSTVESEGILFGERNDRNKTESPILGKSDSNINQTCLSCLKYILFFCHCT